MALQDVGTKAPSTGGPTGGKYAPKRIAIIQRAGYRIVPVDFQALIERVLTGEIISVQSSELPNRVDSADFYVCIRERVKHTTTERVQSFNGGAKVLVVSASRSRALTDLERYGYDVSDELGRPQVTTRDVIMVPGETDSMLRPERLEIVDGVITPSNKGVPRPPDVKDKTLVPFYLWPTLLPFLSALKRALGSYGLDDAVALRHLSTDTPLRHAGSLGAIRAGMWQGAGIKQHPAARQHTDVVLERISQWLLGKCSVGESLRAPDPHVGTRRAFVQLLRDAVVATGRSLGQNSTRIAELQSIKVPGEWVWDRDLEELRHLISGVGSGQRLTAQEFGALARKTVERLRTGAPPAKAAALPAKASPVKATPSVKVDVAPSWNTTGLSPFKSWPSLRDFIGALIGALGHFGLDDLVALSYSSTPTPLRDAASTGTFRNSLAVKLGTGSPISAEREHSVETLEALSRWLLVRCTPPVPVAEVALRHAYALRLRDAVVETGRPLGRNLLGFDAASVTVPAGWDWKRNDLGDVRRLLVPFKLQGKVLTTAEFTKIARAAAAKPLSVSAGPKVSPATSPVVVTESTKTPVEAFFEALRVAVPKLTFSDVAWLRQQPEFWPARQINYVDFSRYAVDTAGLPEPDRSSSDDVLYSAAVDVMPRDDNPRESVTLARRFACIPILVEQWAAVWVGDAGRPWLHRIEDWLRERGEDGRSLTREAFDLWVFESEVSCSSVGLHPWWLAETERALDRALTGRPQETDAEKLAERRKSIDGWRFDSATHLWVEDSTAKNVYLEEPVATVPLKVVVPVVETPKAEFMRLIEDLRLAMKKLDLVKVVLSKDDVTVQREVRTTVEETW